MADSSRCSPDAARRQTESSICRSAKSGDKPPACHAATTAAGSADGVSAARAGVSSPPRLARRGASDKAPPPQEERMQSYVRRPPNCNWPNGLRLGSRASTVTSEDDRRTRGISASRGTAFAFSAPPITSAGASSASAASAFGDRLRDVGAAEATEAPDEPRAGEGRNAPSNPLSPLGRPSPWLCRPSPERWAATGGEPARSRAIRRECSLSSLALAMQISSSMRACAAARSASIPADGLPCDLG
mmetsp:Transcript_13635/g.44557  ORF Transcript_13635/g.44557 Transcript_13635/m.44557 type:complete len:245 (+) Transcript_13635:1624-2358(+)|eukprot:scaffold3195_cov100-Isochrysis_galbana.AAC.3